MTDRTVRLHRVFRCPPSRVYRAFLEPLALAKWLPPKGFVAEVHTMEARVGGRFRLSFHNFSSGGSHAFHGEYLRLDPDRCIAYTDEFEDPALPGVLQVRIDLAEVACGCELRVEQAGIPAVIPLEMCYLGWQESLDQLAALVEPDIPG